MRQLTTQELKETDSTLIIPARIWDALPREVTDVMYDYIGRLGRIGNTPAYRFDGVPQYKAREFESACSEWKVAEIERQYQASLLDHRFYCPKEDCDNRPFTVRPSELADADGWIACDVCGGVCEEMP